MTNLTVLMSSLLLSFAVHYYLLYFRLDIWGYLNIGFTISDHKLIYPLCHDSLFNNNNNGIYIALIHRCSKRLLLIETVTFCPRTDAGDGINLLIGTISNTRVSKR